MSLNSVSLRGIIPNDGWKPENIVSDVTGGIFCGLFQVMMAVSATAFVYSGKLSPFVANGIALALLSGVILSVATAVSSSYPITISNVQDSPAAVMALAAASISSQAGADDPQVIFYTVVVAIGLTTLLTGITFFVLGTFKLGDLTRFVPYPVIGGFIAGTGLLLLQGSIIVMTGITPSLETLPELARSDMPIHWMPGILMGLIILFVLSRTDHFFAMPTCVIASILVFYVIAMLGGLSWDTLHNESWLLGPFPEESMLQQITLPKLSEVSWPQIFANMNAVGAVVIISVIGTLLNVSGLELVLHHDYNLNHELRATGIANMLAGALGGMVGYHAVSITLLGHHSGGRSRLVGLVVGAVCLFALVTGATLLSYLPTLIVGGLLAVVGMMMVKEWLVDSWFRLVRKDYLIILMIVTVILVQGYLEGILTGIVVAVALFVVEYSNIGVIKLAITGSGYQSKVDRPFRHRDFLSEQAESLLILKLQGFIFFGTAHQILGEVFRRIQRPDMIPIRFIVLDFSRIAGFDSSAIHTFAKMRRYTYKHEFALIFTGAPKEARRRFAQEGLDEDGHNFLIYDDLDRAVEWCEDQILLRNGFQLFSEQSSLQAQLNETFPGMLDVRKMMKYLERMEIQAGVYLAHQGQPADALYFIESGIITAILDLGNTRQTRLRTMHAGTVIGEIGVYLGTPRSATLVVEEPSVIYRMSAQALGRMKDEDPELTAAFHEFIAHLLAKRVRDVNAVVRAALQ